MKKASKFKGLKSAALLLCLLSASALLFSIQAQAQQQQYISPRLQLGLHTQASLDSPIKELISSGTAVEVIKIDKDFSRIKTQKGIEGWVKSKFLTQEEPAVLKVEKMQDALQRAQQFMKERLQDEEAEKSIASPSESQLSIDEKAAYEDTISGLKEELKAWEQLDRQDKQAHKKQLEKNNQLLKEKLAMIASVATGEDVATSHFGLTTQGELPELEHKMQQTLIKIVKKNYILLLMVSGLSFFLGIFLMDLINRRRHGGYRI
ncbi:MAG: TIGR04211 family SH3 domain-containing protein [Gammaproteobacteria bacterium]|nr:TIGR04211 family SH3 domain-containing protein [Gammaproteobacteria bacterium]